MGDSGLHWRSPQTAILIQGGKCMGQQSLVPWEGGRTAVSELILPCSAYVVVRVR